MFSGRKKFAIILCCFLTGFCVVLSAEEKKTIKNYQSFQFSVLGDSRPQYPEKVIQPPMFKKAIEEINLLGSELAVNVGDLILGYDADETLINKEWDEYVKTCKDF